MYINARVWGGGGGGGCLCLCVCITIYYAYTYWWVGGKKMCILKHTHIYA